MKENKLGIEDYNDEFYISDTEKMKAMDNTIKCTNHIKIYCTTDDFTKELNNIHIDYFKKNKFKYSFIIPI